MRTIFIICLLVLASCKKDEEPKKQYKVTAVCNDKQVTYRISRLGTDDARTITKPQGMQAEYDFEDVKPASVIINVNTSLSQGQSVKMKYYENGVVLDSMTYVNNNGTGSGVVGQFIY